MQAGDSVLIIGAMGQVGQAAMSICHWKKAKPVALVRKDNDWKNASSLGWEAYQNVPSDHSFDLILNTVGNVYWKELFRR